jgi:hypothetical protein
MPSPYKHPKTGVYWYRQRVPADLLSRAVGQNVSVTIDGCPSSLRVGAELKVSLRTKAPRRAKELAQEAEAQFHLVWASFKSGPVTLSMRDCVALSGDIYRTMSALFEEDARPAADWAERHRRATERARAWKPGPFDALKVGRPRSLRERWGTWVDGALADHHLTVDAGSYDMLLTEFDRAFGLAAEMLERRATGDFSPDPNDERFPAFERPTLATLPPPAEAITFRQIIDAEQRYRATGVDAKPFPEKSVRRYRSIVSEFAAFRGDGRIATTGMARTFTGCLDVASLSLASRRRWQPRRRYWCSVVPRDALDLSASTCVSALDRECTSVIHSPNREGEIIQRFQRRAARGAKFNPLLQHHPFLLKSQNYLDLLCFSPDVGRQASWWCRASSMLRQASSWAMSMNSSGLWA